MRQLVLHIKPLALILLLLWCATGQAQFEIPAIPEVAENRFVYDPGDFLQEFEKKNLAHKVLNYADSTSTQIVIAIIPTTQGEDITQLSTKWGETWGVGQAEEDNGIFILLAHLDRKIDISTGYGIEYRMTDMETEGILNTVILPQFKRGDYYAGLDKGLDAIFTALNGEFVYIYNDDDSEDTNDFWLFPVIISSIMLLYLLLIFYLGFKYKGNYSSGGGSVTYGSGGSYSSYSSSSSSSSYSSSSSSSSSSFGGGSFGGGGASGSW